MSGEDLDKVQEWRDALARASMPGAVSVIYTRNMGIEDGVLTTSHTLKSFAEDGAVIGDERDYDLLKAVMMPLERLSEGDGSDPLVVTLNVQSGEVTFGA
ncbi:MAG: hypothetical protein AAF683_03645 [Pseudomonadota bacterium]